MNLKGGATVAFRDYPAVGYSRRTSGTSLSRFLRLPGGGVSKPLLLCGVLSAGIHAALYFVGAGTPPPEKFVRPVADDADARLELVPAEAEPPAGFEEEGSGDHSYVEAPQIPSVPEPRVAVVGDSSRFVVEVPQASLSGVPGDAGALARQLARGGGDGRALQAVFNLTDLDRAPVVEVQPLPRYPSALEHSRVTGEVVVGFIVDAKGQVREARILESSRIEFEEAALQAVSRWKFKPGRKGGRAVAVRMEAPIAFALPNRS